MNFLVSVIVLTYNSAKTIIETLDSINRQTYSNIELIISDDCSVDNTIEICQKWINEHKDRFNKVILIKADKNTGIPANCNRALEKANGIWIKYIAGDDILADNAIEYIHKYKGDEMIVAGYYQRFYTDGSNYINFIGKKEPNKKECMMFESNATQQLLHIRYVNFIPAPTVFIKKELFSIIGLWDERYPLMEDYPFWIKAIKAGYKIGFIHELISYYRISQYSITSFSPLYYYNIKYYLCENRFKKENIYPLIPLKNLAYWYNEFINKTRFYFLTVILKNKKSKFGNNISSVFERIKIHQ